MYCTRCGKELEAGTKFCPNCGEPVRLENRTDYTTMEDYAFMGVIFFFMKRRTTPNKAKACLITGIVSFVLNFIATYALLLNTGIRIF